MRFGTDGVRGRYGDELTAADAARLGRAVARAFDATPVVIGRDTRESGPALSEAVAGGLGAEAAPVLDLGVASTPAVAFTAAANAMAGIVVSASHNPWHDNGLKVFAPGGRKLDDAQQRRIEAILADLAGDPTSEPTVTATPAAAVAAPTRPRARDALDAYHSHVVEALEGRSLAGVTVAVDAANGAASASAPAILRRLGATVIARHIDPDGYNINAACGSTDLADLQATVVATGADLGLGLDGDADRVLAVAGDGSVVDGDTILALAAADLHERGRLVDDTVVVTVMSNLGFHRAMAERSIAVHVTPVGDRHVLDALDRNGWVLGGEQSGHVIYRELASTGDGVLTGVLLADLLARREASLAELAGIVTAVPQVLENVTLTGPAAPVIEALAPRVAAAEADLADRGRVVVRASGTEPLVRVMVEADDDTTARRVAGDLVDEVARLDRQRQHPA